MNQAGDWHKRFFRVYPLEAAAPSRETEKEARFLIRRLNLKPGREVLDLGCGIGRHSLLLAQKGLVVTGFDSTERYLRLARRRAEKKGLRIRWLRGDMRRLPFAEEFDAVISCFTSFGYFTRLQDDLLTLKKVREALKPGGLFFLDVANGARILAEPVARHWVRYGSHYFLQDTRLRLGRDPADICHWTFIKPGEPARRALSFTRLYTRQRLDSVLRSRGFAPLRWWGDFNGAPYGRNCRRLMVLARKA